MENIVSKTPKELANEFKLHVNTIYKYIERISILLNYRKGQKKLTPQQIRVFYEYYGSPN
jgi:transposase